MIGFRRTVGAVLAATAASWVTIALAFSTGADSGLSGGPISYGTGGGNCTACHPLNLGPGTVELLGAPRRYRTGVAYDLAVRITDVEQAGAGFEISAEGDFEHLGSFQILDAVNTQYTDSGFNTNYVTHTRDGVDDSITQWGGNGGSYEYVVRWTAPDVDRGPVTLFVASQAINDGTSLFGERFYPTYATLGHARPGDSDGDGDVDLRDVAAFQRCYDASFASSDNECPYLDLDGDNAVAAGDVDLFANALSGPTATLPAAYLLADVVRGGGLYDKWWKINGASEPDFSPPFDKHPLYPPTDSVEGIGLQAGSTTFRCKECHGWDYKGLAGAYGSGQHRTDIVGVFGTLRTPRELFDLLKANPLDVPGGHDMDAFGMSDADIWDVVKMTLEGVVDTDDHIDESGAFVGSELGGSIDFSQVCLSCHGPDGRDIDMGHSGDPEYVGTVANDNPWEFLHKIRFGNPGTPMPSTDLLRWNVSLAANVGVFAQTLPTK